MSSSNCRICNDFSVIPIHSTRENGLKISYMISQIAPVQVSLVVFALLKVSLIAKKFYILSF